MCLVLIWGLCSAHVFLFIASTMLVFIVVGEFVVSIIAFTSKYETRLILLEQLPKLGKIDRFLLSVSSDTMLLSVITYRQGTDERANRALDFLQSSFRCCGSDGRLSFQNHVPLSCNMYSVGCLTRTMYFLDSCLDALAYVLLFFSLIKFFLVLFFYSYLCIYHSDRRHWNKSRPLADDRSTYRYSSSFESSSPETQPKKVRIVSTHDDDDQQQQQQNDYVEQRRMITEDCDQPRPTTAFYQTEFYEPRSSRKLSSISEKTEKTETDDSEPDLLRLKHYKSRRRPIITAVPKHRRRVVHADDEYENDSGQSRLVALSLSLYISFSALLRCGAFVIGEILRQRSSSR